MPDSDSPLLAPWTRRPATAWLAVVLLAVLVARALTLNEGYFDFGDGNYLYISWRLSEGAALYADILSPQPPLHLHLGAGLVWLGDVLGDATLTVRSAQILVRLITGWLLYLLARRWEFGRGTAVLGVTIWATLPIGHRWSLGWQSENIEIPLLLGAQILLARRGGSSLLLSGLAGAGALLCNMTAAPYVLFNGLFALVAYRARGLLYWGGLLGTWGLVALLFEWKTGAFFQNVIFNQVGTYPDGGLLSYAWGKIAREGTSVLLVEGLWVILALFGMAVAGVQAGRRWCDPTALYRGIYSLGGLLAITYVTKGGTVDYIFCLGEPYVALWAAWMLVWIAGLPRSKRMQRMDPRALSFLSALTLALAPALAVAAWVQSGPVFGLFHTQRRYEWPEERMALVVEQIEAHSEPGDLILAPPHFAFHTRRRLVEDFSSTYLWYIKWVNERREGDPGEGTAMMRRIGDAIREGHVALVALNGLSPELVARTAQGESVGPGEGADNRYIAQIGEIRAAVVETCRRVGPPYSLPSNLVWGPSRVLPEMIYRQEELTFWVPRDAAND